MADMTFDAVTIGGGNKALVTAMYLAKYGKMKVGVFEERHELGGGLGTHEAPAPGFSGNTHASTMASWYYLPLQRDFPGIEDKGIRLLNLKCTMGVIMKEDQTCMPFYHSSNDPTGEKTAKEMARFSTQRDVDTWTKMFELAGPKGGYRDAFIAEAFTVASAGGEPGPVDRWWSEEMKRPGSIVNRRLTLLPADYAIKELWDHPGMQIAALRWAKAAGYPSEAGGGTSLFVLPFYLADMCLVQGGTHSAAHACARVFLENGGKFFTKSKVDKILIENGTAKGIRLADGTEVAAKVVISGVDPHQLCFDLVGAQLVDPMTAKRVANLELSLTVITWYTWAVREAPDYKSADFNPDINNTHWVILAHQDVDAVIKESHYRRVGQVPPTAEIVNFHHHSRVDKTQSPDGKHVVGSEIHTVPAYCMTERQWMEYKKHHAEETMAVWQEYMRNMSWDNVIGYDAITPYDIAARGRNFAPAGNWNVLDRIPGQFPPFLPVQEWTDHRIRPIKNLYGTGSGWGIIASGSSAQGYTCYKTIAEDLGLARPWDGQPW